MSDPLNDLGETLATLNATSNKTPGIGRARMLCVAAIADLTQDLYLSYPPQPKETLMERVEQLIEAVRTFAATVADRPDDLEPAAHNLMVRCDELRAETEAPQTHEPDADKPSISE